MLAIGNGAEQEILAQMKMLGANNIVVTPIVGRKKARSRRTTARNIRRSSRPAYRTSTRKAIKRTIPPSPRRAARSW
jgi:putative ABC transport system permease protein